MTYQRKTTDDMRRLFEDERWLGEGPRAAVMRDVVLDLRACETELAAVRAERDALRARVEDET